MSKARENEIPQEKRRGSIIPLMLFFLGVFVIFGWKPLNLEIWASGSFIAVVVFLSSWFVCQAFWKSLGTAQNRFAFFLFFFVVATIFGVLQILGLAWIIAWAILVPIWIWTAFYLFAKILGNPDFWENEKKVRDFQRSLRK